MLRAAPRQEHYLSDERSFLDAFEVDDQLWSMEKNSDAILGVCSLQCIVSRTCFIRI